MFYDPSFIVISLVLNQQHRVNSCNELFSVWHHMERKIVPLNLETLHLTWGVFRAMFLIAAGEKLDICSPNKCMMDFYVLLPAQSYTSQVRSKPELNGTYSEVSVYRIAALKVGWLFSTNGKPLELNDRKCTSNIPHTYWWDISVIPGCCIS